MIKIARQDVLARASEIIKERGWWQDKNSYVEQSKNGKPGRVSLTHALRLVIAELRGSEYDLWEARYALMAAIGTDHLERWNDNSKTKFSDVLAALDNASKIEKSWDNHMAWAWIPRKYGKRYS